MECGSFFSEALRTIASHVERAFKRDARAAESAFFEKAADERYTVGHAARRIELRQRIFGIGRPVAARFGDFDEAGAERERGLAGEIGNGEYFVAQ